MLIVREVKAKLNCLTKTQAGAWPLETLCTLYSFLLWKHASGANLILIKAGLKLSLD
jgi:hypothetical protein